MEAATTPGVGGIPEEFRNLPLGIEIEDPSILEDPRNAEKFRQLLKLREQNPLLAYVPHVKQKAFHERPRKIKVFLGGERAGKTVSGVLDDLIQGVDRSALPPHLLPYKIWEPPFTCRIVTPDFGNGYQEMLRTLREWCPSFQLYKSSWEEAFTERSHILQFGNGSFFEFMTQEQDVSKFGGTSRCRIHYDEEPKGRKGEEIREANASRLIQFRGDELFTFSPVHGLGGVGHTLWDDKGDEVAKDVYDNEAMVVVVAEQDDNPTLDEEGKREAEAKMDERMRGARKSGIFVHSEGLVYESFDRDLHVKPKFDPEFIAGLEQYDCIDPGNTTAVLFTGFDSDNVLYVYDELYLKGDDAIPENAAKAIFAKRREWKLPLRPKRTLIDPASAAKHHQTNERTDAAYKRAGIKTIPANNDVELGINEVRRRLVNRSKDDKPQPLVLYGENCKWLLWEKRRYRMETDSDGKLSVVKENDHLNDTERYVILARPLPKKRRRGRAERETYVPGTAPPVRRRKRPTDVGVYGKFS